MFRLLGIEADDDNAKDHLRDLLMQPTATTDPCQWKGVQCESLLVTGINWKSYDIATRDSLVAAYEWIPPTVHHVDFFGQRIEREIITQRLSPVLLTWRVCGCHIQGTFELRTLPKRLNEVDCSYNFISGTLHLASLPKRLESLNFSNNDVSYILIDMEDLPASLRSNFKHMRQNVVVESVDGRDVNSGRIWWDSTPLGNFWAALGGIL